MMHSAVLRSAGHHGWPAGPPGSSRGSEAAEVGAHTAVVWDRLSRTLLVVAGLAMVAAKFLPLWGMTLVSIQYPKGLRMVVYADRIIGDLGEINALNHYIGMAPIYDGFFAELRVLPLLFYGVAGACLLAALVRRWWITLLPLTAMAATAAYGLWSMRLRLYHFGHDLDPTAAIDIAPFTPRMFGESVIAQFGVYSYFSWGTWLPMIAGLLVGLVLWRDLRSALRRTSAGQRA